MVRWSLDQTISSSGVAQVGIMTVKAEFEISVLVVIVREIHHAKSTTSVIVTMSVFRCRRTVPRDA